jgi:hypothetical protein
MCSPPSFRLAAHELITKRRSERHWRTNTETMPRHFLLRRRQQQRSPASDIQRQLHVLRAQIEGKACDHHEQQHAMRLLTTRSQLIMPPIHPREHTWSNHGLPGLVLARCHAIAVALHTRRLQKQRNDAVLQRR